jgi:threonine dehydrogenase-like Zn-dependent dehydrogenase
MAHAWPSPLPVTTSYELGADTTINTLATKDRKALIAKTFDFDQAPQAYQYFVQAKHIGKVLIKF